MVLIAERVSGQSREEREVRREKEVGTNSSKLIQNVRSSVLRQRLVVELDGVLEVSLLLVRGSHSSEGPERERAEAKRASVFESVDASRKKGGKKIVNELGDHLVISSKLSSLLDGLVALLDSLVELSLLEEDGCEERRRKENG